MLGGKGEKCEAVTFCQVLVSRESVWCSLTRAPELVEGKGCKYVQEEKEETKKGRGLFLPTFRFQLSGTLAQMVVCNEHFESYNRAHIYIHMNACN